MVSNQNSLYFRCNEYKYCIDMSLTDVPPLCLSPIAELLYLECRIPLLTAVPLLKQFPRFDIRNFSQCH
jgi:hypothetical protein